MHLLSLTVWAILVTSAAALVVLLLDRERAARRTRRGYHECHDEPTPAPLRQ